MAYTRAEQETSIVWDEEEKEAHIYTASPVSMRRLDRLCEEFPAEYRRVWQEMDADGRVTAARYQTGCKMVRFKKPASEAMRAHGRLMAGLAAKKRAEMETPDFE